MTTYSLSYYDLKLINALKYFRRESTAAEYSAVAPLILAAMSLDAHCAYIESVYKQW